ncbi:zinc finger protein 142 isoform X1 [Entelurus aequoreus]|uniref:zinc finger protein 142 isoform X1 n=2 Tax=Entelurus aequoreus TaxID=161455 RepID=UPI002B1DDF42|nr:zinc finger protein 142 isoform X1 [Entelurus aequoreus]
MTVEMMEQHRCATCGQSFSDGGLSASHSCSDRLHQAPTCRPRRGKSSSQVCTSSEPEHGKEEAQQQVNNVEKVRKTAKKDTRSAMNATLLPTKEYLAEGAEHIYRTHTCPKCRRCFKMRSHLQEHLHLHSPDPSLQCPTCKRFFTSRSKLRVHRLREEGEKVHHCHLCEYSAVERNAVHRHLITKHADEAEDEKIRHSYPCPACGQSFNQSRLLKAHMKTHNVKPDCDAAMSCFQEGCSFQTPLRKVLVQHAAEAHEIEAVECRHYACAAIFPGDQEMEAHYRTHLAYHCSQCEFSSSNKSAFLQHQRHGHPGSEKLCCDFCTFFTFNPVEFEQHVGHLHANEKIHHCPQCSYVTSHKRGLRRHMLMHSGEKPFKCSLCDFRCRDVSYLSKHLLTHSDDKNFMCAECGYVTKWKHYLNVHMRKHAGELRYECDQCPYRCHRMDQLNSHKLRHQAKSLMCEICAYACKRKYELRNHMLAKHSAMGKQASVYKCKYCTYTTCFRQALQNHENCKHTRLKQYCCALCPYSSFSSISLFLHKRKAHGYVPGDQTWLKNYAAKERERNSSSMSQDFHNESLTGNERSEQCTEEAPADYVASEGPEANSQGVESLDADEVGRKEVFNEGISDSLPPSTSPEYCTLVLTALTAEYETAFLQKEDATAHMTSPLHCSKSALEKEDILLSAHSSEADKLPRVNEEGKQSLAADDYESEQETLELDNDCGSSESSHVKPPLLESCLKSTRTRNKDQSEAMVLEGRVQMLVVPTKDGCDKLSYITKKKKTLKQHSPLLCCDRTPHHECQACGAQFKQRRGLNSHIARKCAAIPKKNTTFIGKAVAQTEDHCAVGPDMSKKRGATHSHDKVLTNQNRISSEVNEECLLRQKQDGSSCNLTGSESASTSTESNPQQSNKLTKKPSKAQQEDIPVQSGKFMCSLCSFSSVRLATVNRHISICQKRLRKKETETISVEKDHKSEAQRVAPHTCQYCPFTTRRRYRLEEHESLHTGIGRHACDVCDKTFGALTKLRQHKLRIHDKQPSQTCPLCDYSGYTLDDMRRHTLRCHTGEMHHTCTHCEARFSSEVALRNHCKRVHQLLVLFSCNQCDYTCSNETALRTHQQGKHPQMNGTTCKESLETKKSIKVPRRIHLTHQCQLCPFASKTRQLLARHLLDEHEEGSPLDKPLRCSNCPFACQHPLVLEQHLRSHGGKRMYKCSDCKYSTGNKQKMTWHVRIHTGEKPYRCEHCSYACIDPSRLKLHMRVHQEEKKYLCPECGYKCKWATQLKYHMTKHTGEKPYACDQCNYRTNRADALRTHRDTQHCDVRSYVCEKCGKAFKTSFILKTHQRQHSDQRPYTCGSCHKAFRWPAGLRHHFLSHTKQQPFHCSHCSYRAKQKFQVIKHLRRHHPDMPVEQGVVRDSEAGSLTLKEALRGTLNDSVVAEAEMTKT